jgi:membrane fusion protein (multidrug efflux system)
MANRATDTVLARASVANPKGGIIDGQLLTVIVETREPEQKIIIPQSALIADQAGIYVFVVEDGKAVTKRVKVSRSGNTDVVVDSGLTGGEQVIVEGFQNIRPGAAVRASPVTPAASRS